MRTVMAAAQKRGAETELVTLKDKNIKICDGCLACEKTSTCHIKDDMQEIYSKILSADAVVLGSPTYFDAPTSLAMGFIDRTMPLYGRIKGKRFASIVVGQVLGDEGAASRGKVENYFKIIADTFGLNYTGSLSVAARNPNDASKIPHIEKRCQELITKILK